MAIYQFFLAVIPRNGLLKKHHRIPSKIKISYEDGYFNTNTEIYWQLESVDPNELVESIDKVVNRADWGNNEFSYNWKTYSENLDNDAWMSVNEATNKVDEFSFRADLREDGLKFLTNMIALGIKHDWLFMNQQGEIVNPSYDEIETLIKTSNAYKFLKGPHKYFEDLDSNNIHTF